MPVVYTKLVPVAVTTLAYSFTCGGLDALQIHIAIMKKTRQSTPSELFSLLIHKDTQDACAEAFLETVGFLSSISIIKNPILTFFTFSV